MSEMKENSRVTRALYCNSCLMNIKNKHLVLLKVFFSFYWSKNKVCRYKDKVLEEADMQLHLENNLVFLLRIKTLLFVLRII